MSKFILQLPLEGQDLTGFCRDPIGYLDAQGYSTAGLPRRVGILSPDAMIDVTTVKALRELLQIHRLPEPAGDDAEDAPFESPKPAPAGNEAAASKSPALPERRILAAPALIFPNTPAEPVENIVAAPQAEAAAASTKPGLPFPVFAKAFHKRKALCKAHLRRGAESAPLLRAASPPAPDLGPLPDAGQSGMVALRRIIGPAPDTGVGTAESAAAEAIILADDRVQVSDTFSQPFRWLCRLEITAATGSKWLGTGWFISPGVIVTAGHCVFMHNHGGWAQSITAHVGQNSARVERSVLATHYATTRGWAESRDAAHDYGVIFAEPADQGYFGYGVLSDTMISGALANISGYPQDKPPGTMWGHTKELRPPQPQTLFYEIDTFGGMSGAPVVMWDGQDYVAIGIHNYGDTTANSASRITEEVFYNLERWKAFGASV
ncbi:trypsin-like serine peptidase [Rhodobacter maris]|uniref:trypsin-like serine peptidase n=1 Tax=Rhodobacter maris TaxID=446682 RepID=UPI0011412670|nr:trypsin-like peptidase domain-containing protein [Rhodobacter maris]